MQFVFDVHRFSTLWLQLVIQLLSSCLVNRELFINRATLRTQKCWGTMEILVKRSSTATILDDHLGELLWLWADHNHNHIWPYLTINYSLQLFQLFWLIQLLLSLTNHYSGLFITNHSTIHNGYSAITGMKPWFVRTPLSIPVHNGQRGGDAVEWAAIGMVSRVKMITSGY